MENQWALESVGPNGTRTQFLITKLPCLIGRSKENDLVIADLGLSRVHATLTHDITGQLKLIDENSTNGTFVNRQRIEGYCLLKANDIIHFAKAEFKLRLILVEQHSMLPFDQMGTMLVPENMALPENFALNETELDELIMGRGLSGAIQPIVEARTRKIVGYELLGRANHPRLPKTPIELFDLASAMDRETDLSQAFREFGVSKFARYVKGNKLFLNVHPKEMFGDVFIASIKRLRQSIPDLQIVVEIHESAITSTEKLREFAKKLASLGVYFAFDDFGAGQARLLELADVPAHFVKFDMSLIRDLHKASPRKQKLVRDLVQMVLSSGSVPLAEGVESEGEAKACTDMGFQLIQGYLTGRPIPVDAL
ncbi:MAG: EAL domain-containing protein [Candidatus Accumulibacter sp.]|jgi:EAL domain-containing protein (putative c-di-GMP-specific phosphodiesterase class I)|nr:EAL domain-containing protein [Accumulibacter sp.]